MNSACRCGGDVYDVSRNSLSRSEKRPRQRLNRSPCQGSIIAKGSAPSRREVIGDGAKELAEPPIEPWGEALIEMLVS